MLTLLLFSIFLVNIQIEITYALVEVIYAVNAGGDSHIDVYGVRFDKDPLASRIGTASDFGKQLVIGRVSPSDQILYQTERYHYSTFGYEIPIKGDGNYVIVLKFSEVYFNMPDQKVFNVQLNRRHLVASNLDIYAKVGRGVAYDEYITFSISNSKLFYGREESIIQGNKIMLEFIKTPKDNPKINAFYVIKGNIDDVPKLPPLPREEDLSLDNEEILSSSHSGKTTAKRRPSGPRTPDPYASDDTSTMLPVFFAVGAAVPILVCLCKL